MFGIGPGEFVIIGIVLLLAVGPEKMPTFFRTVGKTLRAFRRTTRELKNAVGFNELLRDDPAPRRVTPPRQAAPAPTTISLTEDALELETPSVGVDRQHHADHPAAVGEHS